VRYLYALVLLLTLLLPVSAAHAQSSEWQQRDTPIFTILYIAGDEAEAERYAGFADAIFTEVTGALGHRVATPIILRLYPNLERYYEANPRARGLSGVVAHADFRRNEVVVVIEQTRSQSEIEVLNNVRHELAHIIASDISENRLNAGFQEGIAQYFEQPSEALTTKRALLQAAITEQRLLPWSAFDDRNQIYGDPDLSYPQTLSVIAFLSERYSLSQVRDFLAISASSSGYRSALQRAFGRTPDELEQEWQAWLPSYLNVVQPSVPGSTGYDLARAEQLIRAGSYADALRELEAAVEGLRQASQADAVARAEQLIALSQAGLAADQMARDSRTALQSGEYERAAQLVAQAQAAYQSIGDARQQEILAEYGLRAREGQQAAVDLAEAATLSQALRYPQARVLADRAAATYAALGDRERATQALELRSFVDQRQSLIGRTLLLLGLGGVALSVARRVLRPEVEPW
jgi:hypothetical protein